MVEKLLEMSAAIVSIALIARYLDVEAFGLYALILTYIGLFIILGSAGLDRIMVRDIADKKEDLIEYLQHIKGASIIIVCLNIIPIIIISYFLHLENKITIAAVSLFAASELLTIYGTLYMSVFRAFEKMEYNTFITFVSKVINLMGLLIVIHFNLGFFALFAAMAVVNAFKVLLTILIFKRYFSSKPVAVSFANSGGIIKEALIIAVSIFFAAASFKLGVFMLRAFGTLKDVAYLQAASAVLIQVQPISFVIVAALYPVISNSEQSPLLVFEKAAKYIFITSLPVMALIFFYGKELILLVYGGNYMDAIPAMKVLAFSIAFTFLANLFEIGLLTGRKQNLLTIGWGITFVLHIALGVLVVPRYGLLGCAAVMSISYAALFFVLFFFNSHYTMFKVKGNIFLKPVMAFIAMAYYLYIFTPAGKSLNVKLDILNAAVSLALYVAVLFMLKAFSIKEVALMKNLLLQRRLKV